MRLLDRHVLTETAVAGGVATGAFVFVLVAGNVLNQVSGAVASGRVSGAEGLELIALLIPGVLPYALPLGLLTGVLLVAAVAQPLAGVVFVLDGVLIGAGDGTFLAWAGLLVLVLFAPAAWVAIQLGGTLVWLWVAFAVAFMGGRAAVLLTRERSEAWLH